jgi:hypothetical protein
MRQASGLMARVEQFQVSKTLLFWACAGAAVATMVVGFGWGGWVTGGTADKMALQAAASARAELAASVCVSRFSAGPDAPAKLVTLKATDSWQRRQVIEDGGWVTMAGTDKPVPDAAALCAEQLVAAKPAGTSG